MNVSQTGTETQTVYFASPCLFMLEVNCLKCAVINSECKKTGQVSSMCYGGYQPDRIPEKALRSSLFLARSDIYIQYHHGWLCLSCHGCKMRIPTHLSTKTKLLEQWLKKKHAHQTLLLTDKMMEVWSMFQGPGPCLRPNLSSIKIKRKFLWLVCQLKLLLEQTAHFHTMAVIVGKFWQAVSIPQHCLLHCSCLYLFGLGFPLKMWIALWVSLGGRHLCQTCPTWGPGGQED